MTNPTVREIVEAWPGQNGYDGLWNPDIGCGCYLNDFMPCEEPWIDCEAGYSGTYEDDDYGELVDGIVAEKT